MIHEVINFIGKKWNNYLSSLEVQEVFFKASPTQTKPMRNVKLAVLVSLQEMLFSFSPLWQARKRTQNMNLSLMQLQSWNDTEQMHCLSIFFFVFFLKGVSINNYFYKAHFSLQSFFITVINFFLNNPKCVPYKEMASYSAIKILHVVFL